MSKRAKTVPLATLIADANKYLRFSDQNLVPGRAAVCSFIENVLHRAEAYNGFRYLTPEDMENDQRAPGIIFDPSPAHKHIYPDTTRREYHGERK